MEIQERLQQHLNEKQEQYFQQQQSLNLNIHYEDISNWKRENNVQSDQKVFILSGGYPALKQALLLRDFIENEDKASDCFDFKWTLHRKDIQFQNLYQKQFVNHFPKVQSLTTKVGLCRALRENGQFQGYDINEFYPRCYDLSDTDMLEEFIEDFQYTRCEAILKEFLRIKTLFKHLQPKQQQELLLSIKITKKRLIDFNEQIDILNYDTKLISPQEWCLLSQDSLTSQQLLKKRQQKYLKKLNFKYNIYISSALKPTKNTYISQNQPLKKKEKFNKSDIIQTTHDENNHNNNEMIQEIETIEEHKSLDQSNNQIFEEFNLIKNPQIFQKVTDQQQTVEEQEKDEFIIEVEILLGLLFKKQKTQYIINGEDNIWIMKPAKSSRGRGIICSNNLTEIQELLSTKNRNWIIQKYIENPIIIQQRKFDIRQWVLITNWNPLTIYIYQDHYVRFAASNYDQKNLDDSYKHLTNNSVGKKCKNQKKCGDGNMITSKELYEYLEQMYDQKNIQEKIEQQIKNAVIASAISVQSEIENRENSFEMFGYDFMIDDQLNVWLIEVNCSPTMQYSTQITENMVCQVLEDTCKLIIDQIMIKKNMKRLQKSYGGWKRIYKSKSHLIESQIKSFGIDLTVTGSQLKQNLQ